ncbi:hypothetical protein [Agromyces sp. NPDC049794]
MTHEPDRPGAGEWVPPGADVEDAGDRRAAYETFVDELRTAADTTGES